MPGREDPEKLAQSWSKALQSDINKLPSLKLSARNACGAEQDDRLKELDVLSTAMERAQVQLQVLSESFAELPQVEKVIACVKPSVAEYQQKFRLIRAHMSALLAHQKK